MQRIYIAGHTGMVGSALVRRFQARGSCELLLRTRAELDLLDQAAVFSFLDAARPDLVIVAAARVGGIAAAQRFRAQFTYENLAIQNHLIHGAHRAGVQRLLFIASSAAYPRDAPQPIREEALLTGPLEPANEPYAIAKIAGIKLCEAYKAEHGRQYVSVLPTNLYGPGDHYDLAHGHVLSSLLRKAHDARVGGADEMVVWGTGTPRREFLHVEDMAAACLHLIDLGYDGPMLNVGCGIDVTIAELAQLIAREVGFNGRIVFDAGKPDGVMRKLLDVSRLKALGWAPTIELSDGLRDTYRTAPFFAGS